jgi:hypothetical protein
MEVPGIIIEGLIIHINIKLMFIGRFGLINYWSRRMGRIIFSHCLLRFLGFLIFAAQERRRLFDSLRQTISILVVFNGFIIDWKMHLADGYFVILFGHL